MADSLRRLVNIGSFTVLQEKIERWLDNYHINTVDQNVARCCEIIELNGKVQSQLFKLLSVTAAEGGYQGGSSVIKSRLLPWLGANFFTAGSSLTADRSLAILAESAEKDREVRELQVVYEDSVQQLEDALQATQIENEDLRTELEDTKADLDASQRASSSDRVWTDAEISDLRAKLAAAETEVVSLRSRTGLVDEYERQLSGLREEVLLLSAYRREALASAYGAVLLPPQPARPRSRHQSDNDVNLGGRSASPTARYTLLPRVSSPLAPTDSVQVIRQDSLIQRFSDLFIFDRADASEILRRYTDDEENVQRICFAVVQEAFTAAKVSFREHKMKIRSNLVITHTGPDTLEEAVQDYINRNTDLYDLPGLISDVIHALNRNPRLYLPPEATFSVVHSYIREACKLAWSMSALAYPLDIAIATDSELFDDYKYRRSYDSEYTAPLVAHHVWPCLMQGIKVIVKGEAVTRRGASLGSLSRLSRSASPVRSLSPTRARSRSPSPRRISSPTYLGRSSPAGLRSPSRNTLRSPSPRPLTASTSLSHY